MKAKIMGKDGPKVVNLNRRQAIRERCLNCMAWEPGRVKNCDQAGRCPLHAYRTGDGPQKAEKRKAAIREYCLWCCNGQSGEVGKCPVMNCPLFIYRKGRVDHPVKSVPESPKRPHTGIFESQRGLALPEPRGSL